MAIQISQLPLASSVSEHSDYFAVCDEQKRMLKKISIQHASESTAFGVGSANQYGHVKIVDSVGQSQPASGEALSARQGNILAQDLGQIEMNSTAAFSHQQGEYFIFIGQFVKCTAPIVPGNSITIGTNVVAKSIGEILKDLNDRIDTTNANVQQVRSDVQQVRSDVASVNQYAHNVNDSLVAYKQSTNTELGRLHNRTESLQTSLDQVTIRALRLGFLIDPYRWDEINYFCETYEDMEDIDDPGEGELAFIFTDWDDDNNPVEAEIYEYRREDVEDPLRWESVGVYSYTGSVEEIIRAINDLQDTTYTTYIRADKIKEGRLSPVQGQWWMDLSLGKFHLGGTNEYVDWNNYSSNSLRIKCNIANANDLTLNGVAIGGDNFTNYSIHRFYNSTVNCSIKNFPSFLILNIEIYDFNIEDEDDIYYIDMFNIITSGFVSNLPSSTDGIIIDDYADEAGDIRIDPKGTFQVISYPNGSTGGFDLYIDYHGDNPIRKDYKMMATIIIPHS